MRTREPSLPPDQRILVVGNGMVAHRLCKRLGETALGRSHRVTVIGEESAPAYDRIRLSESLHLAGEDLLLSPRQWYAQRGIELRTGERVDAIDRDSRVVRTDLGAELPYDRLVLATGAAPVRPPLPGIDLPGIRVFRSLDDLKALRERARTASSAAVIGGGLLGLEAAKVLHDAGLSVCVLEASTHLMPRQLDAESAAVLRARVEALGVSTRLAARTRSIEPNGAAYRLRLEGEPRALLVDMVVVAAGIRPRDQLAEAAGLELGARGGVIVDDALCTSDPRIYAIGECALHRGTHYGLVAPGYAMADALASTLCGGSGRFERGDTSCHLKLLGVPVSAVGLYDQELTLVGTDVEAGRRSLLLDGRRLVGATAVGEWPDLPRVHHAIQQGRRISEQQLRRFKREGELWAGAATRTVAQWPAATIVCNCTGVTRGQLSTALAEHGADPEELARETGASTVCGACSPLLCQLAGSPPPGRGVPGRMVVLVTSVTALLLALVMPTVGPIPFADSVQLWLHELDRVWRDPLLKQISGYALTGLALIGGLLSLRKRAAWFSLGSFGHYRALHTLVGTLSLVVLLAHTGMHFGRNLNMALMTLFVALSLLGGLAGLASGMEASSRGRLTHLARVLRPRLTALHMLLFWPLPLLLGLHVFAVYYF